MNTDLIIFQGTQNIITDNNIDYLDLVWKMSNKSKYAKWYMGIIKKAQNRNIETRKIAKEKIGYVEQHHIVPVSLGGDNSKLNLVFLTSKEHFISHHLLIKMFSFGIFKEKMNLTLWAFINKNNNKVTAKTFSLIREIKSISMLGNSLAKNNKHTEEGNSRISKAMKGNQHAKGAIRSEEQKLAHSLLISGENHPMFGKGHSQETKDKMSIAKSGENHPMFGKEHLPETKDKMSMAQKGEKNHRFGKVSCFKGKTHTTKTREIMKQQRQIQTKRETALINMLEEWLVNNILPMDIVYQGKRKGHYEKLFYAKELVKRGIIAILI
jgi:hypothetical protein